MRQLDIRLKLDGERLQISAPKGALSDAMRGQLARQKSEIVRYLRAATGTSAATTELRRQSGSAAAPLSFGQRRLWFLDQLSHGGAVYSIPGAVRLRGTLDTAALQQTLNSIVERHSILRTTFHESDGKITQIVGPAGPVEFDVIKLNQDQTGDREQEIEHIVARESATRFNLDEGPLVRATLIRVDDLHHVLMLNMHHIVADGWSLAVIVRELGVLYEKISQGQQADLAPLSLQYSDFAIWQQQTFTDSELDSKFSYWWDHLSGALPVLDLPMALPRPPVQSYVADTQSFVISPAVRSALETLSREARVTLFMTLLAAFKLLLHRYSAETDILVGSPIANRQRTELENMVGFFLNTLVLRTDLSGDPTFLELLERVREVTLGAFSHQDMPFEELVARINPERSASHAPLFQSMFVLQNAPAEPVKLGDLDIELLELEVHSSEYDLDMQVLETPEGLRGFLRYSRDLFHPDDIARFIGHYCNLLESIVAAPDLRISQLNVLDEAEKHVLLEKWNDTQFDFAPVPAHQQIASRAAACPDAIAFLQGEVALTYKELTRRASVLSAHLCALGIRPDDRIGICLDRTEHLPIALLGVWGAGAAYVPLDPGFPPDRLRFMIEDSGLSLILTETTLTAALPETTAKHVIVDTLEDTPSDGTAKASANIKSVAIDAIAYVIYTSGSSGQPKGVEVEHRQVANFLDAMQNTIHPSANMTLLALTTISFDISVLEIFLPLVVGGRLLMGDGMLATDVERLGKVLSSQEVDFFQATPTTWRMLVDNDWGGNESLVALCGGESLGLDLAEELVSRCGTVWNLYGPTETTVWSLAAKVEEPIGTVTIGRPIGNTRIYILDDALAPTPVGVPGELFIAGDGVTRGYHNRPELTSQRYLPNPFEPGSSRMYRTGDLVRYLPDGHVEFLRRIDHQVKLRGFRIELGEIEQRLVEYEQLLQAVVVVQEVGENDQRLVAYYIVEEASEPSPSELRRHLEKLLPEYMIPSHFVQLDRFPRTPNAKIDRKNLPMPDIGRPSLDVDYVAPSNDLEKSLARAWQEVLKLDRVGVNDNFFELGGNSLLLIQLQREVQQQTNRDLQLVDFFRFPTISSLAALLSGDSENDVSLDAVQDRIARQRKALAARNRWN